MRHRLLCPSGPDRRGNEPKPTLRVLQRGDLNRLPHQVPFHLDLQARQRQSLSCHPILPGSRVEPRLPPPGGLLRRARKPALESAATAGRGWAGRGAQARWAPGWAEEAPCSTPDAITLPETRRDSRITAETLPRLLPPLRPSLVACFLGSFPWRPAGGVGKSSPSQLNT